ncbi:ATP-grasp domain-containing protein [Pseudoduganella chitinolytica]|uniref:ATP-grasp domain-containing protein n=1 Tax=Pseudoduganella chitinolytica TaxID=34070 RepID=A0ABY8B8E3_9BURK|nr:hypothetical protein [Pseudoduganella chitinolytica]WEF32202.1 hypothetical protein PX653_22720 [Pseudoduganella chitinolytica]
MNKNILIITLRDDSHVDAVVWGLTRLGHNTVVWYWEDFPKLDTASLCIDSKGEVKVSLCLGGNLVEGPLQSIWIRRQGRPVPATRTHPHDVWVVQRESEDFIQNILPLLGDENTLWINSMEAERAANSKAAQLIAAAKTGIKIPSTLMSNEPTRIRQFVEENRYLSIFKGFCPAVWNNDDGSRTVMRTSLITTDIIATDFSLSACPGIYQPYCEKQYELRVTRILDRLFIAKIDSQSRGFSVDWRFDDFNPEQNVKRHCISPEWESKIMAVFDALKLQFGCMDLIVTPENDLIFLEVNSAGQFLWKEISDSSLELLDAFCSALGTHKVGNGNPALINLAGYLADYYARDEAAQS